jgi:endonuclease
VRLVVARCAVDYEGRLSAHLPMATRLIMVKADGCVAIHADGGAYKPLNWMNAPNRLVEEPDRWVVTNPKGERLVISIEEVLSDTSHDLGVDPGLQKDGVEAHLQELLAEACEAIQPGLRLVRREHATEIGPVDLLCRDAEGNAVAIEIKRRGEIDGVEQLTRYLTFLQRDPACGRSAACSWPRSSSPRPGPGRRARHHLRRGRLRRAPGHRPPPGPAVLMPRTAIRNRLQLEAALEAADLGMWEWDITSARITWSPTLERIYGLAPGGFDGTFDAYLGFIHPDDRATHVATIQQAAEEHQAFAYRYRIVRPDGSVRWLRGSGRALVDEQGTLTGMTGVCTDVTHEVERERIVDTLRRSLLPPSLPTIPGVELASLFRPGTAGLSGDFFDLFPIAGDRWGVVIGDVCGKGPDAASLTALARYTMRAAAISSPGPAQVLELLNRALLAEDTDRFCTAAHLQIRSAAEGIEVRSASGGHPPPLLCRSDGEVTDLGVGGRILGVFDEVMAPEVRLGLDHGDLLLLYTDGVTEARRSGEEFGEQRLVDLLRGIAGQPAATVVAELDEALASFGEPGPTDDVAVLAIRAVSSGPG